MAAPGLSFSVTGNRISGTSGYDHISVTFQSDIAYVTFECRATKAGQDEGVGKAALVASFSTTPAQTARTFEVYEAYLLSGDGEYRISLFAQGEDGSWNDNHLLIPSGSSALVTADGERFLCER